MATLKMRRGKWYARVLWYTDKNQKKEKQIPLRTTSKIEAKERLREVCNYQDEIREGLEYDFPWFGDNCTTVRKEYSIKDAVADWLRFKKSDGTRSSTTARYRRSLLSLMKVIGSNTPLNELNTRLIDLYKEYSYKCDQSAHGINLNLRSLKAFLKWCQIRDYVDKVPTISMIKVPKTLPMYLPDMVFTKVMKLDWLSLEMKEVFWFYRETGCRLSEPFHGELRGNMLLISGADVKQGFDREIILSDQCLVICHLMREAWNRSNGTLKSWTQRTSRAFLKAIRSVDGEDTKFHFHCLRHTFAVRRWLMTGDIYLVKKELGHSTVTTTEKYAEFSLARLQMDFPNIKYANNDRFSQGGHDFGGHKVALPRMDQGT